VYISLSFRDLTRDRQTDDKCDDRFVTLTLTVCEPNNLNKC